MTCCTCTRSNYLADPFQQVQLWPFLLLALDGTHNKNCKVMKDLEPCPGLTVQQQSQIPAVSFLFHFYSSHLNFFYSLVASILLSFLESGNIIRSYLDLWISCTIDPNEREDKQSNLFRLRAETVGCTSFVLSWKCGSPWMPCETTVHECTEHVIGPFMYGRL